MLKNQSGIAWGQIVISALITALLALAVGIGLHHYTSESPDLIYTVFQPAHFEDGSTRTSIYSARLENAGRKEAEDVQVFFELPPSCRIQSLKIEPSLKAIKYTQTPSGTNTCQVQFDLLNPGENAQFLVLVDQGEIAPIRVEVRGKGLVGHEGTRSDDRSASSLVAMTIALLGALSAIVALVSAGYFTQRRLRDISQRQKERLNEEILALRTQERTTEEVIERALLGTRYRLFFNPAVPGLSKTKPIAFAKDGAITEGNNRNESSWRIRHDYLEVLDSGGLVHSRFSYSPSDGRFYQTNDPDNGSIRKHRIRDQYMVPEE